MLLFNMYAAQRYRRQESRSGGFPSQSYSSGSFPQQEKKDTPTKESTTVTLTTALYDTLGAARSNGYRQMIRYGQGSGCKQSTKLAATRCACSFLPLEICLSVARNEKYRGKSRSEDPPCNPQLASFFCLPGPAEVPRNFVPTPVNYWVV